MSGVCNSDLNEIIEKIINEYNWYLSLRKFDESWWSIEQNKIDAFNRAEIFSDLIHRDLIFAIGKQNSRLFNKWIGE